MRRRLRATATAMEMTSKGYYGHPGCQAPPLHQPGSDPAEPGSEQEEEDVRRDLLEQGAYVLGWYGLGCDHWGLEQAHG